jgi:enterochelin esterase-like enzyme
MSAPPRIPRRTRAASVLHCISMAGMLTAAVAARAQVLDQRPARDVIGMSLADFLTLLREGKDPGARLTAIQQFCSNAKRYRRPIVEDSTVLLFYQGDAGRVSVPGDINGWRVSNDVMTRVEGTDFFYLARKSDPRSRFEYKFAVDSTWVLDPNNSCQAMGGFGPNSEVCMPGYRPPPEILYREEIRHGTLDTLSLRCTALGRSYPVFVYRPYGFSRSRRQFPAIFVTDGGEYLSLGLMHNILDNLIAEKRIRPLVAVFVDPRTDVRDSRTSMRMTDYAMSDTFVKFLVRDVRSRLMKKYRLTHDPKETGIMGASLGGLIATYAAYVRPDVFGVCVSQSPAYWINNGAIFQLIERGGKKPVRFSIDTGTMHDSQKDARAMRDLLLKEGFSVRYAESPEGHNWANWRARIPGILTTFWGGAGKE